MFEFLVFIFFFLFGGRETTPPRPISHLHYNYLDPNTGGYVKDSSGNKIEKPGFSTLTTSPLVLGGINKTLPKATDKNTPSEVTYSIVIWVDEIKANQTTQDSGQVFAGGIVVNASGADGKGITGVFSAGGVENQEG